MADYLTMIGRPLGAASADEPPATVWGIADYLANEAARLGTVPWELPGVANLMPRDADFGYLWQSMAANPHKFLRALAEAEEQSSLNSALVGGAYRKPTPIMVEMVGMGSGVFDWPDQVKNAMNWAWGEGPFAGGRQQDIRTYSPLPMARLWVNYHAASAANEAAKAGASTEQQGAEWAAAARAAGSFARAANANTSAVRSNVLRNQVKNDMTLWLDKKVQDAAAGLPTLPDTMSTLRIVAIGGGIIVGGLVLLRLFGTRR